jgi:hypothetical protein
VWDWCITAMVAYFLVSFVNQIVRQQLQKEFLNKQ